MISKVVLTAESFSAGFARVGSLVGMRSFVNQQIVRLSELAVAVFADELLFGPLVAFSTNRWYARRRRRRRRYRRGDVGHLGGGGGSGARRTGVIFGG